MFRRIRHQVIFVQDAFRLYEGDPFSAHVRVDIIVSNVSDLRSLVLDELFVLGQSNTHRSQRRPISGGCAGPNGVQRSVELFVAEVRPSIPAPRLEGNKIAVSAALQQSGQVLKIQVRHGRRGRQNTGACLRWAPRA